MPAVTTHPDRLAPPSRGARWDLPAGREQGQMHRSNRFAAIFMAVFFGLVWPVSMLLLGFLAYEDQSPAGVLPLAGIGPVMAVCYLTAWALRRRGPAPARHLALSAGPVTVAPGGEVQVELRVLDPAKVGTTLEVGLVCVEAHEIQTADGALPVRNVFHSEWRHADRRAPEQRFRFHIPEDAIGSIEDFVTVSWRLSTREPRKGLRARSRNVPIWVTDHPDR